MQKRAVGLLSFMAGAVIGRSLPRINKVIKSLPQKIKKLTKFKAPTKAK